MADRLGDRPAWCAHLEGPTGDPERAAAMVGAVPPPNFEPAPRFLPHVVDTRDWTIRPLAVSADATAALEISQTGTGRIWVGTAPNGGTVGLAYTDDGGASWSLVELPSPLRITSEQVIGNFLSVAATAALRGGDECVGWLNQHARPLPVSPDAGRDWTDVPLEAALHLGNGTKLFALPNGRLVVVLVSRLYLYREVTRVRSPRRTGHG